MVDNNNQFTNEKNLFTIIDNTTEKDNLNLEKINLNEQVEKEITEEEYLLECSRYNDIEGVKDVLECGVVKINYQDINKNTALHMAAANSNNEIMELLINAGIDLNLVNSSGNTSLHWAAINNNFEGVKILVKHNANLKIKNELNKTASEEGFDRGYIELSEYLIEFEVCDSENSSIIKEDIEMKEFEEDVKNSEIVDDNQNNINIDLEMNNDIDD